MVSVGNYNIANRFASQFQSLLNRHHLYPKGRLADLIHSTLCESHLNDIFFPEQNAVEALLLLKPNKCIASDITSKHLKAKAVPVRIDLKDDDVPPQFTIQVSDFTFCTRKIQISDSAVRDS